MTAAASITTPDALWKSLRDQAAPIGVDTLRPYMRLCTTNSATRPAAAAAANGSETTVKEYPLDRVQPAASPDAFLDSYALVQRVDVVNEDVLPFVPFVQPLSLRQFQVLQYGMLLSASERTLLVLHRFVPPIEQRVRDGTSTLTCDRYSVDVKHSVPQRALLPGEAEAGEDDDETARRAKFGRADNSDANDRERVHHAFLLRLVEDARDGGAIVVPEFRLTFVNRGSDGTHIGAAFVCTGCYASANQFFDVHSDLREQRDFYTQLPYYSRFTADRFEPLRHREELFALWKRLTGGSVLADAQPHPQIGEEAAPVCGYAVEDYIIAADLQDACRRGDEVNDSHKTCAARTVLPPSASASSSAAAAADRAGVVRYLKSIDVSGGAGHMADHSVVKDREVCDAVAVTAGAVPIPEVRPGSVSDFIVRRCTYINDRMAQRVVVEERRAGPAWRRHWEGMCQRLGLSDDFTKRADGRVDAARIVMRDTRSGENVLEDGEIAAYVPSDAESGLRTVYSDEAEEQLRLWVTKALIACESYGVHLALLPVDTDMILSRCIGLLFDNDGGYQRRADDAEQPQLDVDALEKERARRRILRIIVDAVEDFVQYSGVLWRVVLYMSGAGNMTPSAAVARGGEAGLLDNLREVSDFAIARGMLAQAQARKIEAEASEGSVPRPSTGSRSVHAVAVAENNTNINNVSTTSSMMYSEGGGRSPRSIRGKFGTDPRLTITSPLRQIRPEVVSAVTLVPAITESRARVREGKGSSVVSRSIVATSPERGGSARAWEQSPPPCGLSRVEEVRSSTLHGLYLDERSQRELFARMDADKSGTVSLAEIKNVLLKKTHKYDRTVLTSRGTIAGRAVHEGSYSAGNVLSAIDNCGVPLDEDHIEQYIARRCRKYGNKMTFEEFSVMLLELARR